MMDTESPTGTPVRKFLVVPCLAAFLCASVACRADLTGVWKIEFKRDGWAEFDFATCTFTQAHNTLHVECDDTEFVSAKVDGRRFSWQFTSGHNQSIFATFSGELQKGAKIIRGTWKFVDSEANSEANKSGDGTFQATRN